MDLDQQARAVAEESAGCPRAPFCVREEPKLWQLLKMGFPEQPEGYICDCWLVCGWDMKFKFLRTTGVLAVNFSCASSFTSGAAHGSRHKVYMTSELRLHVEYDMRLV